jgi:hypothetical protein
VCARATQRGDALTSLRAESGRDKTGSGQPDEGDEVVLVGNFQPQVGLGQEKVQAQGGGQGGGNRGPAAAEFRDQDRERQEGEGEI